MRALGLLLVWSATGCGDDGDSGGVFVPPPQGAFRLTFQAAEGGGTCPIQPHVAKVGAVDEQQITALVTAGEPVTDVSCTVRGAGSFELSATIAEGATKLMVSVPSVDGSASEASPALGSAIHDSPETARPYVSTTDHPCQFFFSGSSEEIASGQAWLSFRCPVVEHVSTATSCGLEDGVLAVDRCKQ
jgi:hypothetical protein